MKLFFKVIFLSFVLVSISQAQQDKMTFRLEERLEITQPDEYIRILVIMENQVDILAMDKMFYRTGATLQERTYEVITALKSKAEATQPQLRSYLSQQESLEDVFRFQSYWITNMFMVEGKPSVILEMEQRGDIGYMDLDPVLDWDRPVYSGDLPENGVENITAIEPGVEIINAPLLWDMGITGAGRIVMGIDTGVDVNHPALSYKWRGNHVPSDQAWFDTYGSTSQPADCDSHGTHTMGTMCGNDEATGNTIGVAKDAEWIAARTICSSPHTSNSIAAFQWAIDPDGNPGTIDDMPDAITNSWYDPNNGSGCGPANAYYTTLNAVEAAGIAVVFSAGNSGPGQGTITDPKNLNTDITNIWSTGAIDGASYLGGNNSPIASFSSRGPSSCGGTGSLLIKPEASAPGVSVRSSTPGNNYGYKSGTSMAAPHVTGAIALLKQFAPMLTGKEIKEALYFTAVDLGAAGEDNNYGTGVIDVYAAFLSLGTPDEIPPTTITDLSVVNIYSNGYDITWTAPFDESQNGVVAYDIRESDTPINNDAEFDAAMPIDFTPPEPSGTTEILSFENLEFSATKYYAIKSRDIWGNVSNISNILMAETYGPPSITVDPAELNFVDVEIGATFQDIVEIFNDSPHMSTLDYTLGTQNNTFPKGALSAQLVPQKSKNLLKSNPEKGAGRLFGGMSIEGSGGPDAGTYTWIDSDSPNGPDYVWNDISTTGDLVEFFAGNLDDGWSHYMSLGFPFEYYDNTYTSAIISTNGFITFSGLGNSHRTNVEIPNNAAPNNIIAGFWDDLDARVQGAAYYLSEPDKFTVQYDGFQKYYSAANGGSSGSYTFQIVLYPNGKIRIFYKELVGVIDEATVGIENEDGSIGLQVAYNSIYPSSNEFAVQFKKAPDWINFSDLGSGRIFNGNSAQVELNFDAAFLEPGFYAIDLVIESNVPDKSMLTVPITMIVNDPVPVELSSFTGEVDGNNVVLKWKTATETNNKGFEIERISNSISNLNNAATEEWKTVGFVEGRGTTAELNQYNYIDELLNVRGETVSYRLKQIDLDGKFNYSDEIELNILPEKYVLEQNHPNPFNPSTKISFAIPFTSKVTIGIFNTLGEKIAELVNGVKESGYHEVEWSAQNIPSGIYIYSMNAESTQNNDSFNAVKKMILLK